MRFPDLCSAGALGGEPVTRRSGAFDGHRDPPSARWPPVPQRSIARGRTALPVGFCSGRKPSDAVTEPLVDDLSGDGQPGGDFGIAFGKSLKPAGRRESWVTFHAGMLRHAGFGAPITYQPKGWPITNGHREHRNSVRCLVQAAADSATVLGDWKVPHG